MSRRQDLAEDLDWLVGRIRDGYDPEKIILFGSLARGDVHEWSGIDLIVKDTEASYGNRVRALLPVLRGWRGGADVVVHSLKEYEKARANGSTFLRKAERDGEVLYERHRGGSKSMEDLRGGDLQTAGILAEREDVEVLAHVVAFHAH